MENVGGNVAGAPRAEQYEKKTQLEHILLRPDTYIGSTEKETQPVWVLDEATGRMVHREISYSPGLYKIFDEILVNASDNKQRDPRMNLLEVEIDAAEGLITVTNNGAGIPIEMHPKEKVYVPELIFGHLLTSSNFNDSKRKTTGGRNGYGAKLCNIFSTFFELTTADGRKQYTQQWHDNMSRKGKPAIKASKKEFTRVRFRPDLERFGLTHLDADLVALLKRRVYDIAGTTPRDLKVTLNGERLKVKTFKDYVRLYVAEDSDAPQVYEKAGERWEVMVTASDGHFQQVSFVNNIATMRGGTHVNHVAQLVCDKLVEQCKKKDKKLQLKAHHVKNHLFVFLNALVENPAFDSQTKVTLTSRKQTFGSECALSDKFFKQLCSSSIVQNVLQWATFKDRKALKKTDGKKTGRVSGIPKLDDANWAGTARAHQCTLVLTEGDSAKALAISGLAVVGRDRYGVFPLKGKLLNVRDAASKTIQNNEEIKNLKVILGLKQGVRYDSDKARRTLRYGHVMIMTDQDHDGSHIKGLIINLFSCFWPDLLRAPGFLTEFITPIVKVTRGRASHSFYTMPEYEAWRAGGGASGRGWHTKYYKGLGTSTAREGREYFSELARHQVDFAYESPDDDASIELAFSRKMADQRKTWIEAADPDVFLDMNVDRVSYADFVNKELVLYSVASNLRAIPSMVDGLKPGQRKILFTCFKRKMTKEIKVAQLAGSVSEVSAYHHGEVSLCGAIVAMAQNFCGSNNVNLLLPNGQFGTRLQGGKDAASPRYIFTALAPVARALFPEADDALLKYLEDDGQSIEPEWYMPVVPTVLVNGSAGIGTGWSSSVPNYNPRDLVRNIRELMAGGEQSELLPWYKGFGGTIRRHHKRPDSYVVQGACERAGDGKVRITELPVGRWTQDQKVLLESMLEAKTVLSYTENHTDTTVDFTVCMEPERLDAMTDAELLKTFKLTSSLSSSNMVLFSAEGRITKYDSPEQLVEEFYHLRLEQYRARKAYLADKLTTELTRLDNKVRFILAVINGTLVVSRKKKSALVDELVGNGYAPFPKGGAGKAAAAAAASDDGSDADEHGGDDDDMVAGVKASDFDYLLGMPMWSLTFEKVQELEAQRDDKREELDQLLAKSVTAMYDEDLDALLAALDEHEERENAISEAEMRLVGGKGKRKKAAPKKKAASVWSGDASDDDDWEMDAPSKKKPAARKAAAAAPAPAPAARKPLAPKKKAAAKKRTLGKKPAAKAEVVSDEEGDDASPTVPPKVELSLSQRLALMMRDEDDEEEDEEEQEEVVAAAPKAKAKTAAAKPKAKPKAAPKKKKAAPKKAPVYAVDSDDEDDFVPDDDAESGDGSDDDDDFEEPPAPARRARRAAKPVTYAIDDDESEDDAFGEEEEEEEEEVDEEEYEEDEDVDDYEPSPVKPKKKAAAAPKKAAPKPKAKAKPAAKPKAKAAPKPKAKAKPKAAAVIEDSDDEEDDSRKRTHAQKKAKPSGITPKPKRQKKKLFSQKPAADAFAFEDSEEDEEDVAEPSPVKAAPRAKRRAAAAKVNYAVDDEASEGSESDGGDEDEEEEESEEDVSEFEVDDDDDDEYDEEDDGSDWE